MKQYFVAQLVQFLSPLSVVNKHTYKMVSV